MIKSSKEILRLIKEKIPTAWEQVDNNLLVLRYIRKCNQIDKLLSQYLPNESRLKILDFGCGHGQTVLILKEMGFEVTGIELREHEYWHNIEARFITYDGINLPFNSLEFNTIVMFGVLEHIGTNYPRKIHEFDECQRIRQKCLISLSKFLKENGLLFIYYFPNKYSPIEIINEMFNLPAHHEKTDKLSLHQLIELVQNSGYDVIKAGRLGVAPAYFGLVSPFIKNNFINKYHNVLDKFDDALDKVLGNLLGQSNFIIAKKRSFSH